MANELYILIVNEDFINKKPDSVQRIHFESLGEQMILYRELLDHLLI
jgi:hypothetical protein